MVKQSLSIFTFALLPLATVAQTGVGLLPLGPELQVNPNHPLWQQTTAVGLALDGRALVLWNGDNGDVKRARRVDTSGLPFGEAWQVSPPPRTGFPSEQSYAVLPDGHGVACWSTGGPCNCRMLAIDGTMGADAFECTERPGLGGDFFLALKPALFADGSFVVVWLHLYELTEGEAKIAAEGRYFNRSGQPTTPTFDIVRDIPLFTPQDVDIAALGDNRAVVVWNELGADDSADGIRARLVSPSGPLGPAFLVNTYTAGSQALTTVASNDQDRFVVAWESNEQDGFGRGIYAQLFDGEARRIGGEFQVSSNAVSDQSRPRAAMDRVGNFVVSHYSFREAIDLAEDTFLQAFRPDGSRRGPLVRANQQILYQQQYASIDFSDAGLLQVAYDSWRSPDGDPENYDMDVMTRRFVLACEPDAHSLCLGENGRFQVRAFWRTPADQRGAGSALPLTVDTGGFTFFSAGNFELLVKVLDACGVNGHYWIFAAGLTDVEVELIVTDTYTGEVEVFKNPLGAAFAPLQKLDLLNGCGASPPTAGDAAVATADAAAEPAPVVLAPPPLAPTAETLATAACSPDPSVLCLRNGRFRVKAEWRDFVGQAGAATAFPVSSESGLFYFFTGNNLELAVKVLDGCAINQHFWVFAVGLTNVQVMLEVEDTTTGRVWRKDTNLGEPFPAVLDIAAFQTCG